MNFSDRRKSLRQSDIWWKNAVVYQVYPRSFLDTDGDGLGDVRGMIGKLDYLAQLGIDVLWFSPVYPGPQIDNGYDIANYKDVDPLFGSLADVDELITKAHERGIRIMMDVVANHTSDEHPWFKESRSSKDNPKRDWYWWRPAREGKQPGEPGAEPTNWRTKQTGTVWNHDEATGEYYLHMFSDDQPDLNWENPEVRAAMHEIMRWWLDRGVDGFRLDVINFISKPIPLKDHENLEADETDTGFEFVANGPRIHEFIKEARREVVDGHEWVISVGEMPGVTVENALIYSNPDEKELDMVFQIEHLMTDRGKGKHDLHELDLPKLKRVFDRWQTTLHNLGWNSLYWNNHDQPRIVSRFGDDGEYRVESAKMLGTILHMMQGTPYVYQGEEIGMTNYPYTSLDQFQDVETQAVADFAKRQPDYDEDALVHRLAQSSRGNARTPMQWDDTENAGFTSGKPWQPVNPNAGTINAKQALADEDSVFHYYRKLIKLRHEKPIVVYGSFELLLEDDERLFAYTRTLGSEQLLVLGNFSEDEFTIPLEDFKHWVSQELLIGNYPVTTADAHMVLRSWETRVYRRK